MGWMSSKLIRKKDVQEIYDLIVETVVGKGESMIISEQQYPRELVKSRFLELNMSHIEYVLECLRKNTTKVYNIKAYLLAALFNAGATMSNYYQAEGKHVTNRDLRRNWIYMNGDLRYTMFREVILYD